MTIGDRIRILRSKLDITQEELAICANTTKQTIHKYETGIIENIPISKITLLAEKLQTTPAYLMGWDPSNQPSFDLTLFSSVSDANINKLPFLKAIKDGTPIFSESHGSYHHSGTDIKADFCMHCNGESMVGARIFDGDIVFVKKQPSVENGEIAAVIVDDQVVLKRIAYIKDKDMVILKSENPKYPDKVYQGEELAQIKIIGKAVAFQSNVI